MFKDSVAAADPRFTCSPTYRNYVPLANLIGIIFQIRDDYVNLQSVEVRLTRRRVLTDSADPDSLPL